jgi:hypothetical protein
MSPPANDFSYGGSDTSAMDYSAFGPESTIDSSEMVVTRCDKKTGKVIRDEKGNIIKWRTKKKRRTPPGSPGIKRRSSMSSNNLSEAKYSVKENNDVDEYHDDDAEADDRIGDAEERVLDIEHGLEVGDDIDVTDASYKTNYAVVKKKKTLSGFIKKLWCFRRKLTKHERLMRM